MTLFELTGKYQLLLSMAEEEDEQVFEDTMEALEGEIEEKADGYAKVIRQLEYDAAAMKAEEKRLSNRRKTLENNISRMKTNLYMSMKATGREKFKTQLFSFGIQKNPPSVVMDTTDLEKIPGQYLVQKDPEINKKQILADLKAGKDLAGLAHIEQSESLRIR